jgi:asparagine synthase (glutamine-hydrolysing)
LINLQWENMCGICGELRFDSAKPSISTIERMVDELHARGPDASGYFSQDQIALGHRRLKIIDLSDCSQQPMVDSTLGLAIVFNGAIYNYKELREELEESGYNFFSKGDTEVILKAYHHWGEACVEKFNGMFAFAIWERDSKTLFLARDRLGIKPLYYADLNGCFRFASTLPALVKAGGVNTDLDHRALHHYMTFHSVVPPPHTILRGVKKLPPATTMRITKSNQRTTKCYWRPTFSSGGNPEKLSLEDYKSLVLEALRKSVARRCTADVPVGVLLSGGVDSSLVVGLLSEAGQNNLNTFTIGFESVDDEKGNEFEYSDIIAKHFSTTHHKLIVDTEGLIPSLSSCVRAMSEPMMSHDNIAFFLLSEAVSRHVKVVQSGQGADEIFGGYYWYPPLLQSMDPVSDYARVFFDRPHTRLLDELNPELISEDYSLEFVASHFSEPGAELAVDKALRIDSLVMLVDDPVKRVDNMTMAWGLEARVPFLDHRVVELAAKIPAVFKVNHGGKYVLKEAARAIIPSEVIDRPKGYFPVPVLKYIRGPYLELVKEILFSEQAKRRALFKPEYVKKLLKNPESHITPLQGSELWQIALLEFWLQTQEIS